MSDKEIKRAYHQQLKRACEVALEDLKRDAKEEEEEAKSAALPQPRGETHVTIGLNFMKHNDYISGYSGRISNLRECMSPWHSVSSAGLSSLVLCPG